MPSRNSGAGGPNEANHTYAGYHAVFEALRRPEVAGTVYLSTRNKKARDIEALARSRGVTVEMVSASELSRFGGEYARGAVLIGRVPRVELPGSLDEFLGSLSGASSLAVVLDGITDPHNLGAILRSADQFEADIVITRERRAVGDTATLARISAGAAAHVPRVTVANIAGAVERLQSSGFWVYGAAAEGRTLSQVELEGRTALVLGSEGEGISRLVRERCDELVCIPTGGHIDSLNVSVAAGILMYETRRRQGEHFE